ncbi:MAG TPA: hypothetical protein VGD98_24810 [Ktedonobacteraceae bacterium]
MRKPLGGSLALCLLLACLLNACATGATQNTPGCTTLDTQGVVSATLPLPGQPFQALSTFNNQWIFVSVISKNAASNGIAVFQQQDAQICLKRLIPLTGTPMGLTLTQKDDLLLVADYNGIAILDAQQAEQGVQGALLGYVREPGMSSTVRVGISPDEHYAFAATEKEGTLSLLDFQRIRADDFNPDVLLGQLSPGAGLSDLAVALDNRYLYVTVGAQSATATSQSNCATQGSLELLDLQRITQNAAHIVIAKVAAGCDPGRVYLSADNSTAWVTTRGDNKIFAFNTLTLSSAPKNALLASSTVGPVSLGMGIVQNGSLLLVANSNCYAEPHKTQTLSVFDIRKVIQGQPAVLTTVHVGACPREVTVESDDQTVLLTDFNSNALTVINAAKLPIPK